MSTPENPPLISREKIEGWKKILSSLPPEPPRPLHRAGRFSVCFDEIKERTEQTRKLLSEVLVVRAESNYVMQCIDYVGPCEAFREIPMGDEPPKYQAVIFLNPDRTLKIERWEEVK